MLKRLYNLPRDSRDTLFLLTVIGWVMLPQITRLPLWCSLLAGGVLIWRGSLALQSKPLPSKWWLLVLLVLTVAATFNTHRTLLGRDAGVTMIVVLLALKTLELRARRDAFVIFFLSFFTMLTNFFFSQSLLTAAAMLIALLGLLTALVNAHMPVGKPPLWLAAKTAGSMALLGAPVMAVLFVLFPRMAPLWGVPGDSMSGRSGLSANMQVGQIASLALDDSIALRVRFTGATPAQSELYFRGPVLSSFNGRDWQPLRANLPGRLQMPTNLRTSGEATPYEVTLEPNNRPWVLLLDVAAAKPELAGAALAAPSSGLVGAPVSALSGVQIAMTSELQWIADRPFTDLARYSAVSHTRFRYGPTQMQIGLQEYLLLPDGSNPRTVALAAQMRSAPQLRAANTPELVNAVLHRLRSGAYSYTLEPGVFGVHTADEFWFDRKEGFCEHIASSFVILMRALDVPARVVTGYQGGERNSVDGFWVIRQSDAHAWAEVWIAGQGWVRVDPTTAVAPGRTGSFARLQAPQGAIASVLSGVFGAVNPSLLANLRATWDAVNNGWNQWVLNYTQTKQLNLLKDIGFDSPSWEDLFYVLLGLLVFVSLCGAMWTLWEKSRHDPWLRLLRRARKRLIKAGVVLAPNSPPRSMATRLGAGQKEIGEWLLRMEAMRYSRTQGNHLLKIAGLQREFSHLPWPKPVK